MPLKKANKKSKPLDVNIPESWIQHPRFQKYWQHHYKIKEWFRKHLKTQINVLNSFPHPFPFNVYPYQQKSLCFPTWNSYLYEWYNNYNHSNPDAHLMKSMKFYQMECQSDIEELSEYDDEESDFSWTSLYCHYDSENPDSEAHLSKWMTYRHCADTEEHSQYEDDEEEEEQFEMEITEDMIAFFQHSQKHREEREARKKASNNEKYVNAEDVGKVSSHCKPPSEQPGVQRLQQMKFLYGSSAAMIQGMETAMQLSFDRNLDLKQPKFWPHLPLKLHQETVNDWVIQHFKTALNLEQNETVESQPSTTGEKLIFF